MSKSLFQYVCAYLLFTFSISAQEKSKKISRSWDSFSQHISIKADKETKFKLIGFVKVKQTTSDNTGKAFLWVRVDIDDHESSFFENMDDRPVTTNEWKEYEIEGSFNKNAISLYFGGISEGDGEFYFDNFQLFIENKDGEFEKTKIENASFEKSKNLDGWNTGIKTDTTVKVAEFSYTQSNDAPSGKKSLLIIGKDTPVPADNNIKNEEGFTQNIGTLVSMLNNLKHRVESQVRVLDMRETDHLMDEKANRIGALILHLAAAEA